MKVDPRHELISIVHYISEFEVKGWQLKTVLDFDYARRAEAWFSPYKDHPAVKSFEELSRKGFTLSAPMTVMLYLSEPPDLLITYTIPQPMLNRAGGEEAFSVFISLLGDFAKETNFAEFRSENSDFYKSIINQYTEKLGGHDYVSNLEQYMGYKQHSYNVILNPLLGPFNIGAGILHADGLSDIYNIAGPKTIEEGKPVFGTEHGIRNLIWHEFAHSYTNPLAEKYRTEMEESSSLFEPIKDYMARSGYPNWINCVDEHIVRAINIRLCAREISDDEAQRLFELDKKAGFVFVEQIAELLKEYEENRNLYPDINHFYPRIIAMFNELSAEG
ncbi:MAG: DUF4932 domain-containing protein [Bacteroidales bacterium]